MRPKMHFSLCTAPQELECCSYSTNHLPYASNSINRLKLLLSYCIWREAINPTKSEKTGHFG